MAEFYHLTLIPRPSVTKDQVQAVLNTAIDWYKYQANSWILYTTSDATKWFARLEPLFKPEGEVLICKLNMSDYQGYMEKDLWEWIRKKVPPPSPMTHE